MAMGILPLRDWRAMAVPQEYVVRAPRADEAAAVATIFEAYDVSQFDALDTSAAEIEVDWARPRFERERDSWVVIAEGRPVAYAEPGPYEEWAVRMFLSDFDPGLWWLAWDDGRVAGAPQPVGLVSFVSFAAER